MSRRVSGTRVVRRFERVPGQYRPHHLRNGIIFLCLTSYLLTALVTRHLPFFPSNHETVRAEFARALNVRPLTEVRVRGVKVGAVSSVTADSSSHTVIVTMALTQHLAIKQDARADIYWRTLLGGNMYIQLDPGSPSAPPLHGMIREWRTSDQVEFDQLLQPLNAPARAAMQQIVHGLQGGLSDTTAAGATLDALGPATQQIAPAVQALRGSQPGDVIRLVTNANQVTDAFARSEQALAGLVSGASGTLSATAAQHAALSGTVADAPAAEDQAQSTLVGLRDTLDKLDPLSVSLTPGARALAPALEAVDPALRATTPLLEQAAPLLSTLGTSIVHLGDAARVGTPLVAAFQPTLERAQGTLVPWLDKVDTDTKLRLYEALGPLFSDLDSAAAQFDTNGFMLRFQPGGNQQAIEDLPCQLNGLGSGAVSPIDCSTAAHTLAALFGGENPTQLSSLRGRPQRGGH
jgi:virulence factor Mce-like protein